MNFAQKSSIALFGKLLSSLLGLIISVLLARYLKVSGVGQYQLILSTQVLALTILAMGFGNASVFFINNKNVERRVIVSNLLKVFFFISFFFAVSLGVIIFLNKSYFGDLNIISLVIFALGSGTLLIYNILMPVLYASLEIVRLQVLGFSSTLIMLIGIGILSFFKIFNINQAIILVGLGNILSTIILLYYLRNDIDLSYGIDFKLIKDLFFYGIKISATNFIFILSSNIVIFLIKFIQQTDGFIGIGLFSRATSVANIMMLIPTTLGPLFYSKWSKLSVCKLHLEVEKLMRIIIFIMTICSVLIFLFGDLIIIILYGEEFVAAKTSLSILSISIVFSSITIILSIVFSSIGKPGLVLNIYLKSLIITTIFSFILIPILSIDGAAIAVLLGILFNSILLSYYCKNEINLSIKNSLLISKNDINNLLIALKAKI